PRVVFVCCHPNDIDEAAYYYGVGELRHFVSRPLEDGEAPLVLPAFQPRSCWSSEQWWNEYLAPPLRLAGALNGLKEPTKRGPAAFSAAEKAPGPFFAPDPAYVNSPFTPWAADAPEEKRLGWESYVRGIEKIAACCREHGAMMILYDLGYPR